MLDPIVKRCVRDVMGFILDPVGYQKPPNISKKWNDVIRFV